MKSCSTDDQLGSAHGPRTVPHEPHVARFCPERNPTGMYQPTAGFTGRAPGERLRRRTVDAPIRLSFFVFVIRRRNNPAAGRAVRGGGRTLDGTRPPARPPVPRRPRARPCERSIPDTKRGQTARIRDRAGVGGQWPVELDPRPRRRPAGRAPGGTGPTCLTCHVNTITIKNSLHS